MILGARTLEQLDNNLGASELVLTDKENERLNLASQPAIDYPYGGMALWQRRREIGGGWPAR